MRGIDLLTQFQAVRVRYLLVLLNNMPRNSHTAEAMSQDDELVELTLTDRDDDQPPSRIRMSEFSPETEALLHVVDRLGDIVAGLVGLGGKKPPRIPPQPRPETAHDRVRRERRMARHQALVKRVLPNG